MNEYQEFVNKLLKKGSKPHKIDFCFGSRDAWKWVRKNKWKSMSGKPCDKLLYSKIVNEVNKAIVELLLDGHMIEFPFQMGFLYLETLPTKVVYKDGELKTNYRTDWKRTLDLWFVDEEARNTHKPLKKIQSNICNIRYDGRRAKYRNRKLYMFRANRSLGKKIGVAIDRGEIKKMVIDYNYWK